jgi:hypothetical protein
MSTDHRSLPTEDSRPWQNNLVMDAVREEQARLSGTPNLGFLKNQNWKEANLPKIENLLNVVSYAFQYNLGNL